MGFFIMERKQISKVDEAVDKIIPYLTYTEKGFVDTQSLIDGVSRETGTEIKFRSAPFSDFNDSIKDFGAMMCVKQDETGKRKASIILNSEKDVIFRRFSLAHELGHLMVDGDALPANKNEYVISTHIRYDITSFSREECERDARIRNEQNANAFALKVLIPTEAFIKKLFDDENIESIAKYFGLSEDAVRSRALLGV